MSRYKPYPVYKDSGVEWIGEVPEHWEVKRLRHVATFKNSNVDKKSYDGQQAIHLCNYTDVYYNEFITSGLSFMPSTASAAEIEQFALKRGDVIITKDSEDPADIGIPSIVSEELGGVVCGYHLTVIRGADLETARVIHRALQSSPTKAHFFVEAPGITRYGLNQDAIGDTPICLPPPQERKNLADHIDRETARIDALIAKKSRFVELLREKRQAFITHAVTKGLDPSVKMKDSGVEWLGEVPEHWGRRRIKFSVAASRNGVWGDDPTGINDIPCVRVADFNRQTLRVNASIPTLRAVPERDRLGRLVRRNNLLLEKSGGGEKQSVGQVVIYDRDDEAVCSNFIARVVLAPSENAFFWCYLFAGAYACGAHMRSIKQTSGIQNLDQEQYFNEIAPHPSLEEQQAIASAIDRETSRIDALITKTQRSINLLKERRSAFITAAVTGQIDLRESK